VEALVLKTRLLAGITALVVGTATLGFPQAVQAFGEQVYVKTLSSSQYTNGVVKSFTWTESNDWAACGVLNDNYYTVYYDILSTTKIHITKVVVDYYVKGPAGSGVWGGWVTAGPNSGNYDKLGTFWGDWFTLYPFKSSTRDSEGYSHAGTYTHTGPMTISGRKAFMEKETTINSYTSGCTPDFDYSELFVSW